MPKLKPNISDLSIAGLLGLRNTEFTDLLNQETPEKKAYRTGYRHCSLGQNLESNPYQDQILATKFNQGWVAKLNQLIKSQ